MNDIADRLESLIPQGDGYNSEYAHTLAEAVEALREAKLLSAEPVAWMQSEHSYDPERHGMQRRLSWKKLESDDAPLYAHPPTDSVALRDAGVSEQDLMALLPGPYYMDTPDGGSVTVLEQLQRMARDAARWRAACAMKDFPQYMGVFGWQMAEIAEMFDTPDQAIDAAIAQQEADHD